jgi:ubiquinone/menaquinone biosynthesis C-methylase UbiE
MSNSNLDLPPLHTQNPLERFSNRADEYAKYRPSYPAAAISAIGAGLSANPAPIVADIGAGTGISSRLIADLGVAVWAIEPNAIMRNAAQPHSRVQFRAGTAEATGLPDRSVDGVMCCQSFHWFEPAAALREFHRILKVGGPVALMWNDRDREDAFTNQYSETVRRAIDQRYFERLDRKASDAEELRNSPLFENYRHQMFVNSHRLDQAGLVGITLSASYVPKTGALYEQLIEDLQQLYQQWTDNSSHDSGKAGVILSYRTHLFLANSRP